jgi:PAS domain S-box-containing protein
MVKKRPFKSGLPRLARGLGRYTMALVLAWTIFMAASLFWNLHQIRSTVFEAARIQARTAFEKDVVYRRWNAVYGGVFVPVTPETGPNPYLEANGRDIEATDGRQYTKINPAYMTRQVHELGALTSGVMGHITSLKPIRPQNAPDSWEAQALKLLENGTPEVSQVQPLGGDDYLRLMRPLITEKSCLPCHQDQGYQVGEIRGGISVSVPLAPLLNNARQSRFALILTHILLWLTGLAALAVAAASLNKNLKQRDRTEAALLESEERYRATFDSIPDSVTVTKLKDGRYSYVNDGFCRITGYSRAEVIGRTPLDINLYADMEDRVNMARLLQEQGELVNLAIRFRKKDGTYLESLFSARPLKIAGEDCLVALAKDVTDLKRSEEEKARLIAQLRQSQKMEAIGALAGGIAHDFNNILAAILGYTELAKMDLPEDSPIRSALEQITKAANRAGNLVRQILAFSRKAQLDKSERDITPIIKESLDFLRASIPSTIAIEPNLEPHLGSVIADATQIQQLVMNLCTNSAHSMAQTGGTLTVSLGGKTVTETTVGQVGQVEPGPYLVLTVRDTGHGIDRDHLDHIFEPFFTTKEQGAGTGMGLAVVHGIVIGHNGAIFIQSEPGQGTQFDIFLPETAARPDNSNFTSPKALPPGSERILLVDDEESLTDVGQKLLESLGYQVTVRNSGLQAFQLLKDDPQRFDLLITDQTMPQMTGAELAQKALELRPDLPVILCTGYSDRISPEQAELLGIRKFLYKPSQLWELAEAVREVLDQPQ